MALVNFNNARIECVDTRAFHGNNAGNTNSNNDYWNLNKTLKQYNTLTQEQTNLTNLQTKIMNVTTEGFTIIRTGIATVSGNALVINNNAYINYWLITNIEYEAGDTISFQIDVNCNFGN